MRSPKGSSEQSPRRKPSGPADDELPERVPNRNTSNEQIQSKERTPSKERAAASKESPRQGTSPKGLQPRGNIASHLLDEEQDDNNSLDSEVDRKRKAEEEAFERQEKWRRRKDRLRGICRYFVTFLCLKRRVRRERLKHNLWVNLGDRIDRQLEIKSKRKASMDRDFALSKLNGKDNKGKKRGSWLRKCFSCTAQLFQTCFQDTSVILKELLGYVDKRTGLPKVVLEDWTFRQRLHENKHGYVFEAMDSEGRIVAVKIRDKSRGNVHLLPIRKAIHTLRTVGAIKREGRFNALLTRLRLAKSFEHPHLATLYAVFDNAEFYVEVTELMLGPCLATHLEDMDTQLDEIQTCKIFTQIVTALFFLHSNNVLFRDLRLCQIFLTKPLQTESAESKEPVEIECKLTDYWCCARTKKKHSSVIQPFYPGDIATMAPEVLQYGEWTDKADVWSAGCLLFELLFGHPPYGGAGHALAMRIVKQDPEYDLVCSKLSESALSLLKKMLNRKHNHRPTVREVLAHPWFYEFGQKDKGRPDGKTPHKIRKIRIQKAPMHRRGMPPENLLVAKNGMFNAGFCSFMGETSCHVDFEIGGPEDWRLFWVTSIRVALWGNGDNPRKIIFLMALRDGGLYSEIHKGKVESLTTTEVEYVANRPIRFLRLVFRDNFGGEFGIAIRKLALTGFEVRPIPVIIDFDSAIYQNCELWMHSEEITDHEISTGRIHWSVRGALERGPRIPGTGGRYWKYRDVYSGAEVGTTVLGILLQPEPGYTIVAADFGLRYVAHSPPMATPPKVRITIESPKNGKESLFKTADLADSAWGLRDILPNGYEELEPLHADNLDIPTDDTLMVEIHFELNSGYLNIPSDFGLKFYYMPNLPTPESEEEFEEINKDELIAKRGSVIEEDLSAWKAERVQEIGEKAFEELVADTTKVEELDEDALDFQAEKCEAGLAKDLRDMEFLSKFGAWGAGKFDKHECAPLDIWACPEDIQEGATDLLNKKLWWEGAWTDDYVSSSSEFRSRDSTPRLKEVEPGLYVASDTTCAATLATPLRTFSGIERSGSRSGVERSGSRNYDDLHRQLSPVFSSPREEIKLDAWGAVDEWEHSPEWMRQDHGGYTDAWGLPLDDKAALELERAERQRSQITQLAGARLNQLRQKTKTSAGVAVAKLQTTPIGKRLIAMESLAEQKVLELESSFAGVCKRLCSD